MISSDMEEVIGVSDRVAVMHEGRISGVLEHAQCSEQNILSLAVGKAVPMDGQDQLPVPTRVIDTAMDRFQ
jgi:ribose transport system ATP-binding protein